MGLTVCTYNKLVTTSLTLTFSLTHTHSLKSRLFLPVWLFVHSAGSTFFSSWFQFPALQHESLWFVIFWIWWSGLECKLAVCYLTTTCESSWSDVFQVKTVFFHSITSECRSSQGHGLGATDLCVTHATSSQLVWPLHINTLIVSSALIGLFVCDWQGVGPKPEINLLVTKIRLNWSKSIRIQTRLDQRGNPKGPRNCIQVRPTEEEVDPWIMKGNHTYLGWYQWSTLDSIQTWGGWWVNSNWNWRRLERLGPSVGLVYSDLAGFSWLDSDSDLVWFYWVVTFRLSWVGSGQV